MIRTDDMTWNLARNPCHWGQAPNGLSIGACPQSVAHRHAIAALVAADLGFDQARTAGDGWHDRHAWWRASVLNTANVGWFSSDRAIREYATDIWNVVPRGA